MINPRGASVRLPHMFIMSNTLCCYTIICHKTSQDPSGRIYIYIYIYICIHICMYILHIIAAVRLPARVSWEPRPTNVLSPRDLLSVSLSLYLSLSLYIYIYVSLSIKYIYIYIYIHMIYDTYNTYIADILLLAVRRTACHLAISLARLGTFTFTGWSFIGKRLSKLIPTKICLKRIHTNQSSIIDT